MLRCVGLLVVSVSGQDQDEASLLQTLRKQNHDDDDHDHGEHDHHHDHHANNYDNVICPFIKLLARYNCIPDPAKLTVGDYKAALDNFGDDGGTFDMTMPMFYSSFAVNETMDATKWDGTHIEADPVVSLGLADPVSQNAKFEALVSDVKAETKHIGVQEFAALLVKQSSDRLVNQSDIKANVPVASKFAGTAMFHLFGTKTDKDTREKSMSKKEFEGLYMQGEIPEPIRKKYSSGNDCPSFGTGFWPFGNKTPTASEGMKNWPTDPSACQITTFPDFHCP